MFNINFENSIQGEVIINNAKSIVEFQICDLTLELSLKLLSYAGEGIQKILKDLIKNQESIIDKIKNDIKLGNKDNLSENLANNQQVLVILADLATELISNHRLTSFLTNEVIRNRVLIKINNNAFVRIDDAMMLNFDKKEWRQFLFPLWIRILIEESKSFMGGLLSK